jgi:hypothetical protein
MYGKILWRAVPGFRYARGWREHTQQKHCVAIFAVARCTSAVMVGTRFPPVIWDIATFSSYNVRTRTQNGEKDCCSPTGHLRAWKWWFFTGGKYLAFFILEHFYRYMWVTSNIPTQGILMRFNFHTSTRKRIGINLWSTRSWRQRLKHLGKQRKNSLRWCSRHLALELSPSDISLLMILKSRLKRCLIPQHCLVLEHGWIGNHLDNTCSQSHNSRSLFPTTMIGDLSRATCSKTHVVGYRDPSNRDKQQVVYGETRSGKAFSSWRRVHWKGGNETVGISHIVWA